MTPLKHLRPEGLQVIRALQYLTEKYPGLVYLQPPLRAGRLPVYVIDGWRTWTHFRKVFSALLPGGIIPQSEIYPGSKSLPDKLSVQFLFPDPAGDKLFRSCEMYVDALYTLHYPETFKYDLETHLPVLEALIARQQDWMVVSSPLRTDNEVKRFRLNNVGWGNGYVGVCAEHPWFGEHYDTIDVTIHGGLTFGSNISPKGGSNPDNLWWVGFDTAHYMDTLERWPEEAVRRETLRLYLQASWAFAGISNPLCTP